MEGVLRGLGANEELAESGGSSWCWWRRGSGRLACGLEGDITQSVCQPSFNVLGQPVPPKLVFQGGCGLFLEK